MHCHNISIGIWSLLIVACHLLKSSLKHWPKTWVFHLCASGMPSLVQLLKSWECKMHGGWYDFSLIFSCLHPIFTLPCLCLSASLFHYLCLAASTAVPPCPVTASPRCHLISSPHHLIILSPPCLHLVSSLPCLIFTLSHLHLTLSPSHLISISSLGIPFLRHCFCPPLIPILSWLLSWSLCTTCVLPLISDSHFPDWYFLVSSFALVSAYSLILDHVFSHLLLSQQTPMSVFYRVPSTSFPLLY